MEVAEAEQDRSGDSGERAEPLAADPPNERDRQRAEQQRRQHWGDPFVTEGNDRPLDQRGDERRGVEVAVGITKALIGEQQVRGVDPLVEVLDRHCRGEREANGGSEKRDSDDGPQLVARNGLLARVADRLVGDVSHSRMLSVMMAKIKTTPRLAVGEQTVNVG